MDKTEPLLEGYGLAVKHTKSYNFPVLMEKRVCANCRPPKECTCMGTNLTVLSVPILEAKTDAYKRSGRILKLPR